MVFFPKRMKVKISPYYLEMYQIKKAHTTGLKYVTNLCARIKKEFVWVNSVADGASHEGEPVEYDRGLIGVFEENLSQHVQNDDNNKKGE